VTQGSTEHVFLAIHRYLTPPTSLLNPFACYPDFGASLWSSETQKEITIVLGNCNIYHAIYWDWDYKIVVMKPLNKVSYIISKKGNLTNLDLLDSFLELLTVQ
jgi:hypothetical protein